MIAVFDIDGVLADPAHRQHFLDERPRNWGAFFAAVDQDSVLARGVARLREVARDHEVVLVSGRPERTRSDTEDWLRRHGIAYVGLLLRRDGDYRPAPTLKSELIVSIGDPEEVALVVDDDEAVIASLTALGYCAEAFG